MKFLVQTAFAAALLGLPGYSNAAAVNGINYDPAHSKDYIDGQNNYDGPAGLATMKAAINKDLAQIKNKLHFDIIKTYYSAYCNVRKETAFRPLRD